MATWNIGGDGKTVYDASKATSSVVATLDESTGEFTVTGTKGANTMIFHDSSEILISTPWHDSKTAIESVTIQSNLGITDMSNWFPECSFLTDITGIPSTVTKMRNTFADCSGFRTIAGIPPNVKDFNHTWDNCIFLESIPGLTITNPTDISGMFNECHNLHSTVSIDFSGGGSCAMTSALNECSNSSTLKDYLVFEYADNATTASMMNNLFSTRSQINQKIVRVPKKQTTYNQIGIDVANAVRGFDSATGKLPIGGLSSCISDRLTLTKGHIYFSKNEPKYTDGYDGDIWVRMV